MKSFVVRLRAVMLSMVVVAVGAVWLTGCGNPGGADGDPRIVGLWKWLDDEQGLTVLWRFNADNTWEMSVEEQQVYYKGTYSISGNRLTYTITHIRFDNEPTSEWYTKGELNAMLGGDFMDPLFILRRQSYSLNGNNLILLHEGESREFTRVEDETINN